MYPATWSFAYKLILLLHILSVIVAFAPAFVWPVVSMRLKKQQKPVGPAIGDLAANNTTKFHGPALVLAGLFGFALVGMSKPAHASGGPAAWKFSQPWVSVALLCWLIMVGLVFGLMAPAEKKAHAGDVGAEKIISAVGGVLHLLLVVVLVMMIFKPGL
jgi:uncharacterized membrane protein